MQEGTVVGGRYEITRPLGQGGMGAVFEARHTGTGRRVALKVISAAVSHNKGLVARLEVEAKAAGLIESDHVTQVIDVGRDEATDAPFLVMEFLAGEDLAEALARAAPLGPEVVARIGVQIALGLEAAHERGVVHRDLKPANVFLSERDGGLLRVKILDFGIAKVLATVGDAPAPKLTRTGLVMGSPLYMSPEQARGMKDLDHRADVWSLGVLLYEAVTGAAPFAGTESVGDLIVRICTSPAPLVHTRAPWIDQALARTIDRALRIEPGERWPSARAMREALEASAPGSSGLVKADLVRDPRAGAAELGGGGLTLPTVVPSAAATPGTLAVQAGTPVGDREVSVPVLRAGPPTPEPPPQPPQGQWPGPTKASGSSDEEAVPRTTPLHAAPAEAPRTEPLRPNAGPAVGTGTQPGMPASEVFARTGSATRGAPPAPGRARVWPFVALGAGALALVGVAVGLGAREGDGPSIAEEDTPSLRIPSAPPPDDEGAPGAVGLVPAELAGAWKSSSERLYDAVPVAGALEFRVRDAKQFVSQGYRQGEPRFELRRVAGRAGALAVVDRARPSAPQGFTYAGDVAHASCVLPTSHVDGAPLEARLEGDELVVSMVQLVPTAGMFRTSGQRVDGCSGLDASKQTRIETRYRRTR